MMVDFRQMVWNIMSEYTEYARWMNKIKAGERNGNNTIVMELNSYNISGFFHYIVKQS